MSLLRRELVSVDSTFKITVQIEDDNILTIPVDGLQWGFKTYGPGYVPIKKADVSGMCY